jgi:signal transduction histidine kinase
MNPVDLLGSIIEVSHSNLEISSRMNAVLNIMYQHMHFDEAIVFTVDHDKRLSCKFKNQKSTLYKILDKYRCHIGEGIIGSVAQKRTPQYYNNRDMPPRFGCLFYPDIDSAAKKYMTFAFLPLSDDSYIYGVLVLCSSGRNCLTDTEKILLSIISREIGGVLRMNDLLISSKKRISELATLSELGKALTSNTELRELLKDISLIIAKALNALFVTIKLDHTSIKKESQRYTYGVLDYSLENYVNELEQEALRLKKTASLSSHIQKENDISLKYSIYSTPIMSKNRLLGTITICGARSQRDFTFEENGRYLINTFANYINNGLENTLLNTKLKDVIKDLNNAQKRIIDQEKFKCLGEMTANIAHEIKNPLVVIGGFTKRLAKRMNMSQTENRYIDIITNEVSRLESILNDVLYYVKDTPIPDEYCNINECLDEIFYLFTSDTTWERMQILKIYDNDLPAVICDVQQIKQVFINIIINAHEAMQGDGTITIKTEKTMLDNKQFVVVSIEDKGGGINPSAINNIFNPFFTTKESGTGLGLAISNKIILNYDGKIEIENVVGKGATFYVYLPVKNTQTERSSYE